MTDLEFMQKATEAWDKFSYGCLTSALQRHAGNNPALYEDPLAAAAQWMVARHVELNAARQMGVHI